MTYLLTRLTLFVGISPSSFYEAFAAETLDDNGYKELDLSFNENSINEGELVSDYADYIDYEISSIMADAKKLFNEQEDILNEHSRPTNYISTNRYSENLSSQERLLNAIKYGLKKESCKSNNDEIKQYCKEDMEKDETDENEEKNYANGDEKKEGDAKNDNILNEDNSEKDENDYNDYVEDIQITEKVKKFLNKKDDEMISRRGSSSDKGSKETIGMCNPMKYKIKCIPSKRWRHINGTCNNIKNPDWGSIVILLRRFSKRRYENGPMGYIPRGGWDQSKLPKARFISETLSHPKWPFSFEGGKKHARHRSHPDDIPSDLFTHMTVSWGQFVAHEISMTTEPERDCCNKAILEGQKTLPIIARVCWNIDISKDVFFKKANITCHPYSRSNFFICPKKSEHPGVHQVNGATAFLDGSAVYGEDKIKSMKLRQMKDGLLKTGRNKTHPVATSLPDAKECGFKSGTPFIEDELTEVSGDTRAAIQPSLASIHTLFMVEHNRIAKELKKKLKNVKLPKGITMDEILFEETRIIIIAIQQKIVYNDYLRSVLGNQRWRSNNFPISPSKYFSNEDASIRNEFATGAFRFGHSNAGGRWNPVSTDINNKIGKNIPEFSANVSIPPFWPLRWHYFDTSLFVTSFNGEEWNEELLGTIYQPAQKTDFLVTDDLTDYLFSKSFKKMLPSELKGNKKGDFPAQDLVARNIHRGRDHGLATYNDMRKFCKLQPLINFKQQPNEIPQNSWNELAKAYNNVNHIDFYMGGFAEALLEGAMVGPTFACVIEKQFQLLKRGDRYFFSHRHGLNHKGVSQVLYKQIMKITLGDIMCTNMVILKNNGTQRDVFRLKNDQNNPYIPCKQRQDLNFHIIAKDILRFYNKGGNTNYEKRNTQQDTSNKQPVGQFEKEKVGERPNQENEASTEENQRKERKAQPKIKGQSAKGPEGDKEDGNQQKKNTSQSLDKLHEGTKKDGNQQKNNTSLPLDKLPEGIKKDGNQQKKNTSQSLDKLHEGTKKDGNQQKNNTSLPLDKLPEGIKKDGNQQKKNTSQPLDKLPEGIKKDGNQQKKNTSQPLDKLSEGIKNDGNQQKKNTSQPLDKFPEGIKKDGNQQKENTSEPLDKLPEGTKKDGNQQKENTSEPLDKLPEGTKKAVDGNKEGTNTNHPSDNSPYGKHLEKENQKVVCGSHSAPTCGQCGKTAQRCNGDCTWDEGKCIIKKKQIS